ncbi:PAS domain-containing sensor histidine kinase [uncultured Methanoregula sp.]|uniref:PAS domain-containing sensor histidine kinase n=1 Tax=uncultured Methanoregula sp. TaxID=1005933 RepID=UPI002AAC363B|nr:PAS domain-containing sensor histidine kinase [uncultured Methanoregula sp.]
MTGSSEFSPATRKFYSSVSHTDLVRYFVILSLSLCCILIAALSFYQSLGVTVSPLFFIPIIYTAYFYPRKGIYIAALCGVAFQAVGYYFKFPDYVAMAGVTTQAVAFVIVAVVIAYFIERIRTGEIKYHAVFEHSQLGIVLFNRKDFSIIQSNSRFLDMLHYGHDELRSLNLVNLLHNPREKERFLERIQNETSTEDFETRFTTKEGDACWVNLSWSAIDEKMFSCTAININGRKLAEKSNNDNMMKYRQLTEHSPTGIVIVQEGKIRFSNPAFLAFSGFAPAEVMGKDLMQFIDPADRERFLGFSAGWNKTSPGPDNAKFHFITKENQKRIGSFFTIPVTHIGKTATMINIVDISEMQKLEDKIRLDNERRRGVIITVAHEMRTPLQPILGYLNLLISDPAGFSITDETKKILERCLASVDRERVIINQMLELSVLESGKLQPSYSGFSLSELMKSVIDAGGYLAKAEITVDIPEDLMITADKDRMYSVFESLLSNAVNYSKPPREIRVGYRPAADGSHHLISIKDNGVGIPETALASIFEPFQLADATKLSRKYDRIGLSLSIAKKVIEMHGGDILVESTVNAGSTFIVNLPKEAPHDA